MCVFPVACMNCGKIVGALYDQGENCYLKQLERLKPHAKSASAFDRVQYLDYDKDNLEKRPEAIVLDNLGIHSICCRTLFLTHVENYSSS